MSKVDKVVGFFASARTWLIALLFLSSIVGWAYGLGAQRSSKLPERIQRGEDTVARISDHVIKLDDTIASLSDHVIRSDSAVLLLRGRQMADHVLLDSIARVATKSWCVQRERALGHDPAPKCLYGDPK